MGKNRCLEMDVLEMMMRLVGLAVGLVVSMTLVLRMRVSINREPREVMQNKHHDHQQGQVKEWNVIEQMILKSSKEH